MSRGPRTEAIDLPHDARQSQACGAIDCGARLEELLAYGRQRVLLVAPFIKQRIIQRLFESIHPEAAIVVYTRWRPEEVAAGVSDLGVLDEVLNRVGTTLRLCTELHAKYYRADDRVLVGSANLTAAALGWAPRSNLELLIESDARCGQFDEFERRLSARSVEATTEMRDLIQQAAEALFVSAPLDTSVAALAPMGDVTWIPHTRHPDILYRAYSGSGGELTSSGQEQTFADLAALDLPPGLPADKFRLLVGSLLIQSPIVVGLDSVLDRPRRFGEIRDFLREWMETDGIDRDPSEAWQTLMRWLLLFLPQRYACETPRHSEIFSRRYSASVGGH